MKFSTCLFTFFVGLFAADLQAQCPVNAGSDREMCLTEGNALHLLGEPSGGVWSGSGVNAEGLFLASAPGHYTLTYTRSTASGCTATDAVVVTVQLAPAISAGMPASVCANGEALVLGADAEVPGVWSGAGVQADGTFLPSAAGVGIHQVTLTAVVNGCTVTDQKTIEVKALPSVVAGQDMQVCPDAGLVALEAAYPNGGVWSGSALSPVAQNAFHTSNGPGVYTFSYSFTSPVTGCTGSDQKSIVVQEAPMAAFEMGISSSCTFPVVVPVTAAQTAGTTYAWKINGQAATALYFDQLGTYAVERIAVKNGCTASAIAAFEVKAQPEFDIVTSSTMACPGEEVAFKANGNANHFYLWSFSNGTEAMSSGIHTQFAEPGDVDVTVTAIADNGCTTSRTFNQAVHIHELPAITVAMSVPVVEAGEAFVLEAANANQATWYFANGQSLEGTAVEATLYQTGEQRVTLEVQSAEGCVSRLEHRMEVVQQSELLMPGQFTPNQDGQNDLFRPLHIGDWNSFLLTVFDLQGRVVFQGTNAFDGWNGQGAQQGIYVYHVSAVDAQSGSSTHQTGRVLLVH